MSRQAINRHPHHTVRRTAAIAVGAAALALGLPVAVVRAQAGISGPAPGVICDQAGGSCYDRQGASIALTQTYLGSLAAGRLSDTLRQQPPTAEFRLSNGSLCDSRAAACWSDGWRRSQLDAWLTRQLFGALPAAGGAGLQGLQAPRSGVICDPAGQVCYDQAGISLGLTREYYGALAEQALLRNLAGQIPPKQFRLSDGSACDVTLRTCWSDGWARQRVNTALSMQLFGGMRPDAGGIAQAGRPAQCRISRWFKVLYSGNCTIATEAGNRIRSLKVQLQDGKAYNVSRQRGGGYQLSDPQGALWPVQLRDQGTNLSLAWSDRVLTVTPLNRPGGGMNLGQLINTLLGQ